MTDTSPIEREGISSLVMIPEPVSSEITGAVEVFWITGLLNFTEYVSSGSTISSVSMGMVIVSPLPAERFVKLRVPVTLPLKSLLSVVPCSTV